MIVVLYYFDRRFTILEIFHTEMADKFSFDFKTSSKQYRIEYHRDIEEKKKAALLMRIRPPPGKDYGFLTVLFQGLA